MVLWSEAVSCELYYLLAADPHLAKIANHLMELLVPKRGVWRTSLVILTGEDSDEKIREKAQKFCSGQRNTAKKRATQLVSKFDALFASVSTVIQNRRVGRYAAPDREMIYRQTALAHHSSNSR